MYNEKRQGWGDTSSIIFSSRYKITDKLVKQDWLPKRVTTDMCMPCTHERETVLRDETQGRIMTE